VKSFHIIIIFKGTYSLPPVPEAAEYELSDNTSSTSTLHDEMIQIAEGEYQIEHGRVASMVVNSKKLCQQAPSIFVTSRQPALDSYRDSRNNRVDSEVFTDANDSNYYQENHEPYARPELYNTSIYKENVTDGESTETNAFSSSRIMSIKQQLQQQQQQHQQQQQQNKQITSSDIGSSGLFEFF
jgi:hypothetical protein